jgi:lipoprotein signal peptidase
MKNLAVQILDFLKPSLIKGFFLVEWILLILFFALTGKLSSVPLLVFLLPLVFFYLLASLLTTLSQRKQQLSASSRLLLIGMSLAFTDQVLKTIVNHTLPYQTSLPILQNWLHIANERNLRGSWLLETFDISFVSTMGLVLFVLPFLLGALVGHSYYITRYRKSVWVDAAYLGLLSGLLSALCDLLLRGYTLDYIQIPNIVTADMKDVLLTAGIAAFFAEAYDNPAISLRWRGWHQESQANRQLIADLLQFAWQECTRLWAAVRRK